jgi:hypothetical protein
MDSSILTSLMLSVGILMFMLPFFIFITLGNSLGAAADDARLLGALIGGGAILIYIVGVGAFSLIQKYNCGKVQSMRRASDNAGIATAIYTGLMAVAAIIPRLRSIVTDIISPEVEDRVRQSLGYGYYSFWGALFGIAIGGTLSSICN